MLCRAAANLWTWNKAPAEVRMGLVCASVAFLPAYTLSPGVSNEAWFAKAPARLVKLCGKHEPWLAEAIQLRCSTFYRHFIWAADTGACWKKGGGRETSILTRQISLKGGCSPGLSHTTRPEPFTWRGPGCLGFYYMPPLLHACDVARFSIGAKILPSSV